MTRPLRLLAFAASALAACNSTISAPLAQLVSPLGLAITQATDRPVLFVASSDADELKVLDLDTLRFIDGPMNLFPGSVLVGPRPSRLAGLSLTFTPVAGAGQPPQAAAPAGAVLAAGAHAGLALIDAADATAPTVVARVATGPGASADPSLSLPVSDVIADSLTSGRVRAYAAIPRTVGPGAISALAVRRSANGSGPGPLHASQAGSCLLAVPGETPAQAAQPLRLALSGDGRTLYVADSAGDGVLTLDASAISADAELPCPSLARLPLGQPTRAVAVAPGFTGLSGHVFAPGDIAAATLADGGIVILAGGKVAPEPGNALESTNAAAPRMRPLRVPGRARELAFLLPGTADRCPAPLSFPACTDVRSTTVGDLGHTLVLAVASDDGGLYYIDADERTLVADRPGPSVVNAPGLFSPGSPPQPSFMATPTLTIDPTVFTQGVTRTERVVVEFHGALPSYARLSGTLTPVGGALKFTTTADLTGAVQPAVACVADLECGSGHACASGQCVVAPGARPLPGDFVALLSTTDAPLCPDLAAAELAITSRDDAHTLSLAMPATLAAGCAPIGAVAELRAAGWTVSGSASGYVGRAASGQRFVASRAGWRFDYQPKTAPPATEALFGFTLSPETPPGPGWFFVFDTSSGESIAGAAPDNNGGLASALAVFNSPNAANLTFVAVTGASELMQVAPYALGTSVGVIYYH